MFVMSPYEFTSKTHSLSTEDLGKIFIHSLIDSPFNTAGTFYYKQKNSQKIRKKYVKNIDGSCCCHNIEEAVFRVQGPYLKIEQKPENCVK